MEAPSCASLKEEGLVIFTRAGIREEGNLSPSSTIFQEEQGLQMVHAKNAPANFSPRFHVKILCKIVKFYICLWEDEDNI